jgi:glucose-1-phosphate cytidylyltransferase
VIAAILAGGRGDRMRTHDSPKPLLRVGDRPILAHVLDIYLQAGVREFVICAGANASALSEWLSSTARSTGRPGDAEQTYVYPSGSDESVVRLIDTGETSMTGGRLRRILPHLDDTFFLTYADGLANVDPNDFARFHRDSNALVTITAVPLVLAEGVVRLEPSSIYASRFNEKPEVTDRWCNAGFAVVEPEAVEKYCLGDESVWERDTLTPLADLRRLAVYRHRGFWATMNFAHEYDAIKRIFADRGPVWLETPPPD